jgi:glycosyltransferase involved in cell wall biosynthesis
MPLIDGSWERGKCGYKLIQYMASGLPVVGSSVGVNPQIIRQGISGYLANTNEDWVIFLATLIDDVSLRCRLGLNGRKRVEEIYSVQQVGPRLISLLQEVAVKS